MTEKDLVKAFLKILDRQAYYRQLDIETALQRGGIDAAMPFITERNRLVCIRQYIAANPTAYLSDALKQNYPEAMKRTGILESGNEPRKLIEFE